MRKRGRRRAFWGSVATAALLAAGGTAAAANTSGTFYGGWPYQVPPTGNYNVFSQNIILANTIYGDLLDQPLAKYYWATGNWLPLLATSWSFNAKTSEFIVNLRHGVKWSDGSSFTSKDVVDTFLLGRLMHYVIWGYVDRVTANGPYQVVFHMSQPSTIVKRYVLEQDIYPASVYGKFADRVAALLKKDPNLTSNAAHTLTLQLQQFRPAQLVVDGPFKIDPTSITSSQLTLVKNPTAWDAKIVKFNRIVLFNGETPVVTPLFLAKEVDYGTYGFPPATIKALEKEGYTIARPPIYSGPAIFFNWKIYPFNLVQVRQAIAYAINRKQNAVVALGRSAEPQRYMAGFADELVPYYISPQDRAKLNPYKYDPAKAAQLLRSVGFKKVGGVWVTNRGQKMSYELIVPAEFADWSAAAQNAAEQLTKFGIQVRVRGVTFTQEPIMVQQGQFQMAIQAWGAGDPNPHFSFVADVEAYNPPISQGPGMGMPLVDKVPGLGTIDWPKLIIQTGLGLSVQQQGPYVTKAAEAFNTLLPIVPLWERFGNNPVLRGHGIAGWSLHSPIWKNALYNDNPVTMLILTGTLHPTK